jgi:hypothetical protein
VISVGRSWYLYIGTWNKCRGVITESMGGIADMYHRRFRDAEFKGLKDGDGWGGERV